MCRQEARRGGAIVDRLCFFTAFFPLVPPRLNMLMRMTMHHRIDQRTSLGCVLGSVFCATALDLQTAWIRRPPSRRYVAGRPPSSRPLRK